MHESEHNALLERLGRLERQHRRLKRAGIAIGGLALMLVVLGQARPQRVVTAERFVLRDASGREHGALELAGAGTPRLTLRHGKSEATLEVGMLESVGLRLSSDQEGVVVELTATGTMSPHAELEMRGRSREGRLSVSLSPAAERNRASIWLSGGETGATLSADERGALLASDPEGLPVMGPPMRRLALERP